ncbi:MAG: conjugal transfer protein TraX [Paenibacillus sp.]|jgi:hypothetical protein|nr:conjugal transfer protein TraX [Paenibacillus sp.]
MVESTNGQEKQLDRFQPLGMQRELLQLTAMVTMLIDHIGAVLFPEQWWLRVIGRISFPLYAFGIVQGYRLTGNVNRYIRRLGLLAVISQLPFIFAFQVVKVNVIGTFFICICTLYLIDRVRLTLWRMVIIGSALAFLIWVPTDYGTYALGLIFIYRYVSSSLPAVILLHMGLNIYYWLSVGVMVQHVSVVSTAWLAAGRRIKLTFAVPRWLWLSFYPVHLVLLAIIHWLFF